MKTRLTIEHLASMVKRGFDEIRKEMVTKDHLKHVATKNDLMEFRNEIVDRVQSENAKLIQSNDRVVDKLDTLLKDRGAHDSLHKHLDDKLHDHEERLRKVERSAKLAG